jgi:transcription elongation GreA/GreB family factor
MSAAIQLVNQSLVEAEPFEKRIEKSHNNVSLFELAHEQRLRRALSYIAELQAEVRTLREELARAERSIAQNETLLRNAMIREQELRAEVFKGK